MKELVVVAHNEVYYRHPKTEKLNPFIELCLTSVEAEYAFTSDQKDVNKKIAAETYRVFVPLERALFIAERIKEAHAEVLVNCGQMSGVENASDPLVVLRQAAQNIFEKIGDFEGTDQGLNDSDEITTAEPIYAGDMRRLKDALVLAGADV